MQNHWVGTTGKSKMTYKCQYCQRQFTKESTLAHHACERKRRFQQENEIGVQWGLQAYVIFYTTTQNSSKSKTYTDFVNSPYYTAFVRFGRHCHSIHCINLHNYTRWLLRNNRRLDHWCSDQFYTEWLQEYLKKESVQDALERSMQCMVDHAHDHPELRNGYRDYFRLVNENRICYHIATGRISPWMVYQSATGQEFLDRLGDDQINNIIDIIDPAYWQAKFRDSTEDVSFVQQVLKQAQL